MNLLQQHHKKSINMPSTDKINSEHFTASFPIKDNRAQPNVMCNMHGGPIIKYHSILACIVKSIMKVIKTRKYEKFLFVD